MNFKKYQRQAYYAIPTHETKKEEIMHWAIGLSEECGEVSSIVKHKYYGGCYTKEKMVEELGDMLWYLSALCTSLGISLADVADFNLLKITYRYPNGEFNNKRSQRRHELEQKEDWKKNVSNFFRKENK